MKKIVCYKLGSGACRHMFHVETFEDLLEQAKQHMILEPDHGEDAQIMLQYSDQELQAWKNRVKIIWDETPEN